MKKLGVYLLIAALFLSLFPQTAKAAELTSSELDLTTYLAEVSAIRGFEVSEEDINNTLSFYEMATDNFASVDELKLFLGDAIMADLSNLTSIYEKYTLDQTTLLQLLNEFGEELTDYIYLNDLDFALELYTDDGVVEQEIDFEANLITYLTKVSAERGFEVTKEYINTYLSGYVLSTSDFETVSELGEFLGDVIKADLSNLDYFNLNYGLDKEALLDILEGNGKTINDFVYLDEIERLIWASSESEISDMDPAAILSMLSQFGLSEAEIKNLENHFISLQDYFMSEEVQAQMESIATRMMSFAESLITKAMEDEKYQPSDAELIEFESMFTEFLSLMKLQTKFSKIADGKETPLSFLDILQMEELDTDLKIEIYNADSILLADLVVTNEFIDTELANLIEKEEVSDTPEVNTVQTVKGGKLPKTSTNYIANTLLGVFISICGFTIYRKVRNGKDEIQKGYVE